MQNEEGKDLATKQVPRREVNLFEIMTFTSSADPQVT